MNRITEFFDELQLRIDKLYEEKFELDVAFAASSSRPAGEMDNEGLYLSLSNAHDMLRATQFEKIMSKQWQANLKSMLIASEEFKDFYRIYRTIVVGYESELIAHAARYIVQNPVSPLETFGNNGERNGVFDETLMSKEADIAQLVDQVEKILKIRPNILFVYAIALTRIKFIGPIKK